MPVAERDASGVTLAAYTKIPEAPGGIGGLVSSTDGTNTIYYHCSHLGNVNQITDNTGAVIQTYDYDAFGNIVSQSGSLTQQYNYKTKESSAGLVYFGARYYDPLLGRFISVDPLGMVDGANAYLYCGNDPINRLDLWGLCAVDPNLKDAIRAVSIWEDPMFWAILGAERGIIIGLYGGENTVLFSGAGQKALAAASSGIPIFRTFIGHRMDQFELQLGVKLPRVVWDIASAIYAYTARGTVQVFLNNSNYKSTFARIEAPIIEVLGKAQMIFK